MFFKNLKKLPQKIPKQYKIGFFGPKTVHFVKIASKQYVLSKTVRVASLSPYIPVSPEPSMGSGCCEAMAAAVPLRESLHTK